MTEKEQAMLALVALRQFTVDADGKVWRNVERVEGSRRGATALRHVTARRADTGRARKGSYKRIQFWTRDGRRWVAAHRIVWMLAHGEEIPESLEVNHKNGNKEDNRPENLELVTRAQNVGHAIAVLGKRRAGQKLEAEQVLQIRALFEAKELTMKTIAERYGVTVKTIDNIVHRRKWAFI